MTIFFCKNLKKINHTKINRFSAPFRFLSALVHTKFTEIDERFSTVSGQAATIACYLWRNVSVNVPYVLYIMSLHACRSFVCAFCWILILNVIFECFQLKLFVVKKECLHEFCYWTHALVFDRKKSFSSMRATPLKMSLMPKRQLGDMEIVSVCLSVRHNPAKYSEIPLLRPPKIKTFYLLKSLFAKFKLFFSSFSTPSVPQIRDHLWDCPGLQGL